MKEKKIIKRLSKAIKTNTMCQLDISFKDEPCRMIPKQMSEKLIMVVKDGDFNTYGITIRRMDDIDKVKVEDSSIAEANEENEVLDIPIPVMELDDWTTVFRALSELGCVVIVEQEQLGRKDGSYAIGRVEKVGKKNIRVAYYGPDAAWEGKTWKIPYEDITRTTFYSRYTEVLSRYLPDVKVSPENVCVGIDDEE